MYGIKCFGVEKRHFLKVSQLLLSLIVVIYRHGICAEFLNEQNQKQAELKRKRTGDQRVETSEMSLQCHISMSPCATADASVQTDHYNVTTEFRQ